MQDNIPDALIAAFERHYAIDWNDPQLRNERLAWRAAWAEATKPCLHQIQEAAEFTDQQIDAIAEGMPGGMDGFLKGWGWRQFAREVLSRYAAASGQAAPAAVAVPDGWRLEKHDDESITVQSPNGEKWRYLHSTDAGTDAIFIYSFLSALAATPAAPELHREWRSAFQEAIDTMEAEIDSRSDAENVRRMKRATSVLRSMLAATPAAAAPVVLHDDAEIIAALEAAGVEFLKFMGGLDGKTLVHTTSGSQKASSVIAGCRALLAGVSAPAAHEQHDAHRELYFAAYALCDGICEDHPAIDDVMDAGSHGRLCNALAQLDSHYGVTSPEERISKDHRAAIAHPTDGVHVNAVASIYVTAGGDREFDDWRVPLPVGSNLLYTAPQAQADARDAEITWPKARDVGRIGDMSPSAHIRVGLDSDNDVYVSVWDEHGGGGIEFCNPGGGGGGQSTRTRMALIALMVAIEADNADKPSRDWWARGSAQAAQQGGAA